MIKRVLMAAAVAACMCMSGGAKAQATNPYVGEIEIFSFTFCPKGWLPTKGQLLQITSYQTLYQLIGTRYGGDGVTTFALPKSRALYTFNNQLLTQCIAYLGVFPSQS
jgi:microcystin-dependent protein